MLNVLIVDDEYKIVKLMENLVNWADYGMEITDTANNGAKALQLILTRKPDVVITDIRMPNISGIEMIRKAKEAGVSSYFVVVSGYSDFEYAQQAIKLGVEDYLLKPVTREDLDHVLRNVCDKYQIRKKEAQTHEELLNNLSQTRGQLKKDLLTNLLSRKDPAQFRRSPEDLAKEYDFQITGDTLCCLTAHVYLQKSMKEPDAADALTYLAAKISRDLEDRMREICAETISICSGKNVIFLLNYNKNEEKQIEDRLHKFHINLLNYQSMYPDVRLALVKGSAVHSLGEFSDSYASCLAGLEHRFEWNDFLIPAVSQTNSLKKAHVISEDFKKEMLKSIEMISTDSLRENLIGLHQALLGLIDKRESVYLSLHRMTDIFIYGVHSLNIPSVYDSFSESSLLECLNDYYTFQDAYAALISGMCDVLDACLEAKKNTEELPIRLARNYIKEHFSEPITLNDVSDVAGFSPAYFSTFFKKSTGSTFMEYLTEVRVDQAKALLLHTTADVSEIASRVGYVDTKYFTKQFKKSTHLTPSEFRKIYG